MVDLEKAVEPDDIYFSKIKTRKIKLLEEYEQGIKSVVTTINKVLQDGNYTINPDGDILIEIERFENPEVRSAIRRVISLHFEDAGWIVGHLWTPQLGSLVKLRSSTYSKAKDDSTEYFPVLLRWFLKLIGIKK